MRKILSALAVILSAVVAVVSCQSKKEPDRRTSVLVSNFARPLTNITITPTPARLARGEYLVNGVLRCFQCHSPLDKTKPGWPPVADSLGAGRMIVQNDSTHFAAPNITPDKETGAGNWTDEMLVRAIRSGIGHDDRGLSNQMPWDYFRELSEEDLASVVVYIRSIPAVNNYLPPRLVPHARELAMQKQKRPDNDTVYTAVDTTTMLARGRYLIAVGECFGCHTAWYVRNPGFFGGGNIIANAGTDSLVASANISSDATGVGKWDDETFMRVIRTGKAGTMHYSMPWITYSTMNDDDLKAILVALKAVPAVEHRIVNGLKPTHCEVCGQKHGYGDQNKIKPVVVVPVDVKTLPSYAGMYIDNYADTTVIKLKDNKLWINSEEGDKELVPIGKDTFTGEGLGSPFNFSRDKKGKVNGFVDFGIPPLIAVKSETK